MRVGYSAEGQRPPAIANRPPAIADCATWGHHKSGFALQAMLAAGGHIWPILQPQLMHLQAGQRIHEKIVQNLTWCTGACWLINMA